MSLASRLAVAERQRKCGFAVIVSNMDDVDREATLAWLGSDPKTCPTSVLHRELTAEGIDIGVTTVKQHRAGTCVCKEPSE